MAVLVRLLAVIVLWIVEVHESRCGDIWSRAKKIWGEKLQSGEIVFAMHQSRNYPLSSLFVMQQSFQYALCITRLVRSLFPSQRICLVKETSRYVQSHVNAPDCSSEC